MGWAGLRHERPLLAGFALGALAVDPSLYVQALALLLAAREWRMAMGAVAACSAACLQASRRSAPVSIWR